MSSVAKAEGARKRCATRDTTNEGDPGTTWAEDGQLMVAPMQLAAAERVGFGTRQHRQLDGFIVEAPYSGSMSVKMCDVREEEVAGTRNIVRWKEQSITVAY